MRADFYVYVIFRPSGAPCYVGKGTGDRWKRHGRKAENPHLANIMAQAGGGQNLPVVIVRDGLTEALAHEVEVALIAAIGRQAHGGPLVNMTDGGEGTSGAKMGPEWRANRSAKAKALWADPEYRARMSAKKIGNQNRKGGRHTDAWKAQNSERMKGNAYTLGHVATAETRAKISAKSKAAFRSPEWRANIAAAHRGKPHSPERIAAMKEGLRRSLDAKRMARES